MGPLPRSTSAASCPYWTPEPQTPNPKPRDGEKKAKETCWLRCTWIWLMSAWGCSTRNPTAKSLALSATPCRCRVPYTSRAEWPVAITTRSAGRRALSPPPPPPSPPAGAIRSPTMRPWDTTRSCITEPNRISTCGRRRGRGSGNQVTRVVRVFRVFRVFGVFGVFGVFRGNS